MNVIVGEEFADGGHGGDERSSPVVLHGGVDVRQHDECCLCIGDSDAVGAEFASQRANCFQIDGALFCEVKFVADGLD